MVGGKLEKIVENPLCKFENQQHTEHIGKMAPGFECGDELFHHFAIPARGKCYHAHYIDVLVEDENARKATWAVHQSINHVSGLTISTPCWDFRNLK